MARTQRGQPPRRVVPSAVDLDDTDWAILRALAGNSGLTNKALAARLGLAESTCAYRVRMLRENGVLLDSRVRLDLTSLGYPIQAIIKVRLLSHNAEHVTRLHAQFTQVPGVIQVFHLAGEDDFHLHVAVGSPEALRDLVLEHITVHRVVRQTETQLLFDVRDGVGVLAD